MQYYSPFAILLSAYFIHIHIPFVHYGGNRKEKGLWTLHKYMYNHAWETVTCSQQYGMEFLSQSKSIIIHYLFSWLWCLSAKIGSHLDSYAASFIIASYPHSKGDNKVELYSNCTHLYSLFTIYFQCIKKRFKYVPWCEYNNTWLAEYTKIYNHLPFRGNVGNKTTLKSSFFLPRNYSKLRKNDGFKTRLERHLQSKTQISFSSSFFNTSWI